MLKEVKQLSMQNLPLDLQLWWFAPIIALSDRSGPCKEQLPYCILMHY